MTALHGIITSLPTPFDGRGALDTEALAREVAHQVRSGAHGLCVLGGTGEFFSLTPEERTKVVDVSAKARRSAGARGPLVVANFLRDDGEWVVFGETARAAGADAVMLAPPAFYKPNRRQFVSLLERLARRTSVPLVVFHTPGRSGVRFTPSELVEIVEAVPSVVGIKDSSADMVALAKVHHALGSRCALLQGNDELYVASLAVGCVGGILAMPSAFPDVFAKMQAAWDARSTDEARALQLALLPVLDIVNGEPMPVLVKAAMDLVGHPVGSVRSPLCAETPEARRALKDAIARFRGELERRAA